MCLIQQLPVSAHCLLECRDEAAASEGIAQASTHCEAVAGDAFDDELMVEDVDVLLPGFPHAQQQEHEQQVGGGSQGQSLGSSPPAHRAAPVARGFAMRRRC